MTGRGVPPRPGAWARCLRGALPAAAVVLALAGTARAETARAPLTREQALAGLASGDLEARRQAAARLGEVGAMADAPALLAALRDPDEMVRALAERSVWRVWSRSGDPAVDALFERGVEQMTRGDGPAAIDTFTEIIARKPDFAEGWNKRATVYFLIGEYERSLKDCDEVIARNPAHFGALAGYGQIYLALDEPERALHVNPNLEGVEQAVRALRRALIERRKGTI